MPVTLISVVKSLKFHIHVVVVNEYVNLVVILQTGKYGREEAETIPWYLFDIPPIFVEISNFPSIWGYILLRHPVWNFSGVGDCKVGNNCIVRHVQKL